MNDKARNQNVGILGIGAHLPEQIRKNDWWPAATVEGWKKEAAKGPSSPPPDLTQAELKAAQAMQTLKDDVFRGAVERRVLSDALQPSYMEMKAAQEAIKSAGIDPKEIDLLMCASFVPDNLMVSNAAVLHDKLMLSTQCLILGTDTACNSLPPQVSLAVPLIQSGRCRYALLTQSTALTRLLSYDEPYSTYFGDGATAVVLGPTTAGRGILGSAHFARGSQCGALLASVPGKRWYDSGDIIWHQAERPTVFRMLLSAGDIGKQAVHAALQDANLTVNDINFFACHQGTPWFRQVIQEEVGLNHAKSIDTFDYTGNLVGASSVMALYAGVQKNLVADDDVLALFASGVGTTWSSLIVRWGK